MGAQQSKLSWRLFSANFVAPSVVHGRGATAQNIHDRSWTNNKKRKEKETTPLLLIYGPGVPHGNFLAYRGRLASPPVTLIEQINWEVRNDRGTTSEAQAWKWQCEPEID